MGDAFSRCHPILNFFYFIVVLGFTMFAQHPVFLGISFLGAFSYAIRLNGAGRTLMVNLLFTLPGMLVVALINPLFNHYGVTRLVYIESSGNWVTLEAMVYGIVLGCVMFIMIGWFSCYNKVVTTDKFVYIFGRLIPALSLLLSMALRSVPHIAAQMRIIRNGQKCVGMDVSNGKFMKKARYGMNLLSILVTWTLENVIETADSMKGRGYGLSGRTAFSIYQLDRRDKRLGCVMLALSAVFSYGCARGAVYAQYNPRILLAGFTVQGHSVPVSCGAGLAAATYLAFGVFCFLPLLLDIMEEAAMAKSRAHVGQEAALTYRGIYEGLDRERGCGGWTS
ncbi:MAG: energy-coupling factor transporter transmembrane protein EcfT [Lachnospiraceae bacterium]|jgi:energy-coupling factor transport system permease protein|nr:energy-coupling factor transporter transmembrane protein EcfT [Lachnospiraceae bacterium]